MNLKRLFGILEGSYTCEKCNSPSTAAIDDQGRYTAVCLKHGKAAEQQGQRVIYELPKT